MLFRNNYGVDLGSSSVKVYSFFRNKSYIEKNMVAYRGRRILAIGNEAYEMFEKSPADISVNSPMLSVCWQIWNCRRSSFTA